MIELPVKILGRLNNLIRQIERAEVAMMESYTMGDDMDSELDKANKKQVAARKRMHDFVRELLNVGVK